MNKKVITTALGIAAFSSSIFCSAFAEPVTRNTEFSVTVNPYLNVTLSSNDVHLPITPSSGGTYGSTYFTASASTNNALGYSLNLSIKDTNTAAAQLTTNLTSDTINVNDGTKPTIPNFSTNDVLTSAEFSASTSTDHLNHWAMSLNDTDHYQKVVSESTIATSDEPIADDVTTLNLATKLDLLTPPGSYSAYFNFEIVANVDNGSKGTEGGSIGEDGGGNAGRVFPANSLLRAFELAYNHAGKSIYVEDANATEVPGWRPMTDEDQATIGGKEVRFAMQDISMTFEENDVTHGVCEWAQSSTANGSYVDQALVMDLRDGKSYWITKYADNKCWMSQNLDYDLDSQTALTHATSDIGWTTNDSSASWTPSQSTIQFNASSTTTVSGWESSSVLPYSADPGEQYVISSGNDNDDTIYYSLNDCKNNTPNHSEEECHHFHSGNYYNWSASTATNDSTTIATQYQTAPNSICPASWRLSKSITAESQTEAVSSEWNKLLVAHGIINAWTKTDQSVIFDGTAFADLRSSPLYIVRAGRIHDAELGNHAFGGTYNTSSAYASSGSSYNMMFDSYNIHPATYLNRTSGYSIRCVAR